MLMLRKVVIVGVVALATAIMGLASLALLSPNFVYVRSECPSLKRAISYGRDFEPIASVQSRHVYLFKSAGDGTLTFARTTGQTYQLGYLTSVPSYILVHVDHRCRFSGRQFYLL